MKYPELIESCKKAIENEWCTGCQALEMPEFRGRVNCKYSKPPVAQDYIEQKR
jgi:hypothetical protein